jgi:hypothetical protein
MAASTPLLMLNVFFHSIALAGFAGVLGMLHAYVFSGRIVQYVTA